MADDRTYWYCPRCGGTRSGSTLAPAHYCHAAGGELVVFEAQDRLALLEAARNEDPSDEGLGSPSCQCASCSDDEERGCALIYAVHGGGRVQCGLPGGHDGSCDFFEAVHGGWLDTDEAAAMGQADLDRMAAEEARDNPRCGCCGAAIEPRDPDPWEGLMDDFCRSCALTRCDAFPGECEPRTSPRGQSFGSDSAPTQPHGSASIETTDEPLTDEEWIAYAEGAGFDPGDNPRTES